MSSLSDFFRGTPKAQLFTSTGTFTPTTEVIYITGAGGGGGGGSGNDSGSNGDSCAGGGGGAGGAYCLRRPLKVTPGVELDVVIGAGGAGAADGGSYWTGVTSNAAIVPVATSTDLGVRIQGLFRVSVAGTIIPSITLATANAAVVQPNTYFRV